MSYEKLGFVSGQTLKAEHLNHIEDGIANAGGAGGMKTFELVYDNGYTVKEEDRAAVIEAVKHQEQFRFLAKLHAIEGDWETFVASSFIADYCVDYSKDHLCGDIVACCIGFAGFYTEGASIDVRAIGLTEEEVASIKSAWGIV